MELIAELERQTHEADGRLYFATDALSRPENIDAMYPERAAWASAVAAADPQNALSTDLVRRLELRRTA